MTELSHTVISKSFGASSGPSQMRSSNRYKPLSISARLPVGMRRAPCFARLDKNPKGDGHADALKLFFVEPTAFSDGRGRFSESVAR